ncbi:hypothetical protein [Micropruina sp.]|uniref:hypothetical protein n=1 Tax=Micropruina sp. TaxID=2737536 RepID=UPI0039E59B81
MILTHRPLQMPWGQPVTEVRRFRSTFRAPWASTLDLLDRELWHLDAAHLETHHPSRGGRMTNLRRPDAVLSAELVAQAKGDGFQPPTTKRCGSQETASSRLRLLPPSTYALTDSPTCWRKHEYA